MVKYSQKKVKKERNELISSFQLRKSDADISLKSFKIFLYIDSDKKYQKHLPFT